MAIIKVELMVSILQEVAEYTYTNLKYHLW